MYNKSIPIAYVNYFFSFVFSQAAYLPVPTITTLPNKKMNRLASLANKNRRVQAKVWLAVQHLNIAFTLVLQKPLVSRSLGIVSCQRLNGNHSEHVLHS